MSGSRKRSAVWNHFEEVEPKKAKCLYCANILSVPAGNCGNLGRHLKNKHPTVPLVTDRQPTQQTPEAPQETLAPTTSTATESATSNAPAPGPSSVGLPPHQPSIRDYAHSTKSMPPRRAELLDEQLVRVIANGYYPFSMVEDEEFKKFVNMLNPAYKLPTRKTLSQSLIPKMCTKQEEKVRHNIENANAVCLTTDGWTSDNNQSYLAVTAHYILSTSETTKLHSNLLGCVEYNERHTSENLTEFLKNIMREWSIENKITAIASDNAANITAAIREGDWRQIPCFAHTLNLCVQSALQHIAPSINKVKNIVEFFKRSSQANHKLLTMQQRLNIPTLKLKQDVATRWNSTYDMLHRFTSTKDAIISTIALTRPDLALSDYDWLIIQSVLPVLKLFYDVTVEVSGEKNVSLAKVIPLCRIMMGHIRGRLLEQNSDGNNVLPEIKNLIENLHKDLNHRFGHIESNLLNAESTILDPRFKNKGFQDSRLFDKALRDLKLKIGRSSSRTTTTPAVQPVQPEPGSSHSIWFEFDQEVVKQTPDNPTAAGIVELDKYIHEPLLKRTEDPLKWWHARKHIYPLLFNYIMKRHNLVATSVPCERIFSKAGYTLNERRRRLTSKKVSQLLFISCNSGM
ncbi:zinc finger BED domain-containing protein 1-like [Trichoplusia ni]|uniref:Zinc finger BED domain-containing protein 1-like n=1 Tax=Trichoplusia ni TaxID=7111 RepID=A0A7E5X3P0_TRINI|nr:zinc finger BED domain-containing protein 1-like [Trichoplusia ni]